MTFLTLKCCTLPAIIFFTLFSVSLSSLTTFLREDDFGALDAFFRDFLSALLRLRTTVPESPNEKLTMLQHRHHQFKQLYSVNPRL